MTSYLFLSLPLLLLSPLIVFDPPSPHSGGQRVEEQRQSSVLGFSAALAALSPLRCLIYRAGAYTEQPFFLQVGMDIWTNQAGVLKKHEHALLQKIAEQIYADYRPFSWQPYRLEIACR